MQNDPVNFVDPSGLDPDIIVTNIWAPTWVSGLAGAVLGGIANDTGILIVDPPAGGEGGGGTEPQSPIAKLNLDRLDSCLGKLFSVQIADFKRDQPFVYDVRGQGAFIAQNKKTGRLYAITTDFTSRTRGELGGSGQTSSRLPYYNWVASDFAKDPNVAGVAKQASQIHEIGNSLGLLTGKKPKAKNPNLRKLDGDQGMALEECAFGGYVKPDGSVTVKP